MSKPKVLITGIGGASGIALLKSLRERAELFVADVSEMAAGLYLVDQQHAFLIPRGESPDFVPAIKEIVKKYDIQVIFPTVDSELLPLSEAKGVGAKVLVSKPEALRKTLDKHALMQIAEALDLAPRSQVLGDDSSLDYNHLPALTKPRRGRGSAGVVVIESNAQLQALKAQEAEAVSQGELLLQEFLPGSEYSVDVLADNNGHVVAAVPRERLKIDSGIAVCARTVKDAQLSDLATALVEKLSLTGMCNVQLRRNPKGQPKLLEINPRVPGTVALTIASGVDVPGLLLNEALGETMPGSIEWHPQAMVRYLEEHLIAPEQLQEVRQWSRS